MINIKYIRQIIFALIIVGLALLFYFFPQIDIYTSRLFYNEDNAFFLTDSILVKAITIMAPVIVAFFLLGGIYFSLSCYKKHKSLYYKHYIKIIYVMLVCIIGPGFLVHNVFKDNFGRARPHKIIEFNGIDKFTPAFVISDQCNKNCSFVSGHAAAGFMLFPLAFVLRKRNKRMMFYIASAVGILIGFARIAVGKHFLSDVLFAGIIVFAISYIFAKILKPIPPD